jgi:hypothetical protein
MKASNEIKDKFFSTINLFQKKFNYLCSQSIEHDMRQHELNLSYPRKFRCVQSSSYPPNHDVNRDFNFNEIAMHIANSVNRTPFERMMNLLEEKTIEEGRKNFNQ